MSNYEKHAKDEFAILGYIPLDQEQEDGPNKWIQENVLELLKVFDSQGHSGASAHYCINMFKRLALFETLAPITGEDWEWGDFTGEGESSSRQNKRCSHVFQRRDGTAYDIDGRVFTEPSGSSFTNRDSWTEVTFPYTPKRERVYVKYKRQDVAEVILYCVEKLNADNFKSEEARKLTEERLKEFEAYLDDPNATETLIETAEREERGENYTIIRTEIVS
jgi:hypothetical protein